MKIRVIKGTRGYYSIADYEIIDGNIIPREKSKHPQTIIESILGPDSPANLNDPYAEITKDELKQLRYESLAKNMNKIVRNSSCGAYK